MTPALYSNAHPIAIGYTSDEMEARFWAQTRARQTADRPVGALPAPAPRR